MDMIQNHGITPDMRSMADSIAGDANQRWLALNEHIQQTYGVKPQIAYSRCSAKPGWNVKYKKSGKALCTLYPEPQSFTSLVVIGASDTEKFLLMRALFSDSLNALFDKTQLFNNTKWLMIGVADDSSLSDIKKLLQLKTEKS